MRLGIMYPNTEVDCSLLIVVDKSTVVDHGNWKKTTAIKAYAAEMILQAHPIALGTLNGLSFGRYLGSLLCCSIK